MLKLKHLQENFDLARFALNHWLHDESTLPDTLRRFRISANAVYPFHQQGKLCFLRLAPTEEKPKSPQAELAFIRWLRSEGYPASEPLPSLTGETLLTLSTPWGEYYASAFARVPGKPLDSLTLSEPVLRRYGSALARLHLLSQRYAPSACWSHEDALDWTDAVLLKCHAPDGMLTVSRELRRQLDALPRTPGQYGLIHYDFEPDNVFFDEASDSCAVIDFDDCLLHWYALDLQQAAGEMDDASFRHFLAGYQEERQLPDQLDALLPLMERFIALYGYARLLRCLDQPPAAQPEWMQKLSQRLHHALKRREQQLLSQ